ncbi:LysR family transcriptional regulator [Hafnia paralvei]|jgi:DNA-binding transcriptional LysR family regulator|uniref:LysR family transcriptional regulator n=1 Tax=Hafnia paralvei TaxID=546367 RepID=A0A2A2MEZ3_9GAMM|nr:LysR family transcriptional regulator [Hafnia paralvei]KHS47211.1 LysR family transcriptional regulator [Hafnia paralvei]MBU2674605.1 LysR family transcriptional regulator [Hafnia paralvei]MCE9903958.1 LysR family transcriptional regulator [Hafnia paralvei]MCE9919360.1 LysR family transcriptional regulator [Hafnia paralvei]MDX6910117.1 LysR family transcriptional regulator [Hafnia paralvei]
MDRLSAMRVFVCVVEQGSLSRAAEKLNLSRAMVSRYLADLEKWIGGRLLHRTTRSQSLTSAGEEVLARCQALLLLSDEIEQIVDNKQQIPRGLLRITSSQSLIQAFLTDAVCEYLTSNPAAQIDICRQEKTLNLVDERIDLAIRITNQLDSNLIARRLGTCYSVMCASPNYAERHPLPQKIEQLSKHNCLTHEHYSHHQWGFTYHGNSVVVPVSGNLSANCATVLTSATLRGFGISLLPRYLVNQLLEDGQLLEVLPDYQPETLGIYGVYTSRQFMPTTLRVFLDFLVSRFASDPRFA